MKNNTHPFARRSVTAFTSRLLVTVIFTIIFISCGPSMEAQNADSTSGYSLSLNPYQTGFSKLNPGISAARFDSQSSFDSSLRDINRDLAVDGLFDNLDLFPGKAGEIGENLNIGYKGWRLFSDTQESLRTIKEHPNDPGSDWERASIGLNLYSYFGSAELLTGAAGGFVGLGTLVKTTAEETRGRVLQNRAENLVFSGGMPLDIEEMRERRSDYHGEFFIRGPNVSAVGGWTLDHYSQHLFERDSQSYSWADTRVSDLRLNNGSSLSGNFFREVKYDERGGNLWNFYDATSTTITRRSRDSYNTYFNGANWNNDYRQAPERVQPTRTPPPAVPTIAPPKDLTLPYANDTKYPPPTRSPIYSEPPKFTPAGIAIDDSQRKEPSSIPLPEKRGGVLLHSDLVTNAPVNLNAIFDDPHQH